MNNSIVIAGVGPGNINLITNKALDAIKKSDILVGGIRNISAFEHLNKETFIIQNNLKDVCDFLIKNYKHKKICVLASGDVGIFSIASYLIKKLPEIKFEQISGISSVQYFCSKINLSWNDIRFLSIHGKNQDYINIILQNKLTALFLNNSSEVNSILKKLKQYSNNFKIYTGENLSYDNEKISCFDLKNFDALNSKESLCIIIIENIDFKENNLIFKTIPDAEFIRDKVPMTKEEIRTLSISKLSLKPDAVIYDIGAGTGSVSVSCAINCPSGIIYSIEKNLDACLLIKKNIEKFDIKNIIIKHALAADVLSDLPAPDCIFIGGSGNVLNEIINVCHNNFKNSNKLNTTVVVNTITPESTFKSIEAFKTLGYSYEITSVNIAKSYTANSKNIMKAYNPVNIIKCNFVKKII